MASTRRTTISREGWYYLIVFLLVFGGALIREVNLLVVLAGMLAGPLLLSRFMAVHSLRGLQARRKAPQGVCAGDLLVGGHHADEHAAAPGKLGRGRRGADPPRRRRAATAGAARKPLQPAVFFPYSPARQTRKGSYRGRLAERGRYQLGPLRLSTRFPFGLFCHTVTAGRTESLIVFPRVGRLTRGWIATAPAVVCGHEAAGATGRRRRRLLRHPPLAQRRQPALDPWADLRPGRKTHGAPVRAAAEPRRGAAAGPVAAAACPRPSHLENVELAVSFAATVVADLCRKGDSNVYLGTVGSRPRCGGGPASAALLQDLMEQLALIEGQSRRRSDRRCSTRPCRSRGVGGGAGPGYHETAGLE